MNVLDDDALLQRLLQCFGDGARDCIARSAGRKRDDELDRPARIVVRGAGAIRSWSGGKRERNSGDEEEPVRQQVSERPIVVPMSSEPGVAFFSGTAPFGVQANTNGRRVG